MAYRPPKRVVTGRGTAVSRRQSSAARIAIARATGRKKKGSSAAGVIVGILVVTILGIMATSVIGAGVGVTATLASMEEGLPDVQQFESLSFSQPTRVFDRTGTVQLAIFQQERRQVVTFEQLPHLLLDATVATEDKTFWTNPGYDATAILRSATRCLFNNDCSSGASTITQQLVRARLLPTDLLAPGADIKIRKLKEILQSSHLTDYVTKTYGEEVGKQRIMTAYLNQIFYGHNAYGIAGAAHVYFDKEMSELTPAEAAVLAAIPKSPVCYDLYSWLPKDPETGAYITTHDRLELTRENAVPPPGCTEAAGTTNIFDRRNSILSDLTVGADPRTGESYGRWPTETGLTQAQADAAKAAPIILVQEQATLFKAPHFVWAMKAQLDQFLADRLPAETGGYTITTTLDMKAQSLAEKWVTAAAIYPNLPISQYRKALKATDTNGKRLFSDTDKVWLDKLRGRGIHNGGFVAEDYKTGDVLAYVGSAGYYRDDLASPQFNPKYDVVGTGYRQPGSAFKPVVYTTGFDNKKITAGTVLLDITTNMDPKSDGGTDWTPKDADLLERGPVLARKALQYSLNIPAIRAIQRIGTKSVDQAARKANLDFAPGTSIQSAQLAGAIGTVELHLAQLVSVYGAFGNGGVATEPRMILDVKDLSGNSIWSDTDPHIHSVWSKQAAWITANILQGNTDPEENINWGRLFHIDNGPNGERRPAALKTGTTNDVRDLSAYGLLPIPDDPSKPAIALGAWMGNSDHSQPTLGDAEVFSSDGPGKIWWSWLNAYSKGWPLAEFKQPESGLVKETIDAYTGGEPGPWTHGTTEEWFIRGTEPSGKDPIDPPGRMYVQACGIWMVQPILAENDPPPDLHRDGGSTWLQADREWALRAQYGSGVKSHFGTRTAYFFGRSSWGGPITVDGNCYQPPPTPQPTDTPPPDETNRPDRTPRPRATTTPDEPTQAPEKTKKPRKSHAPIPVAEPGAGVDPGVAEVSGGGAGSGDANIAVGAAPLQPARGAPTPGPAKPARPSLPTGLGAALIPAIVDGPGSLTPHRAGRKRIRRRHVAAAPPQHTGAAPPA